MAKLIVKARYIKKNDKPHSKNMIKYIAQRDGVVKSDESWKYKPVTIRQQNLISSLLKDFPDCKDSFEYQDYLNDKNQGTASEFISRTIDENVDLIGKRKNYVEYIAMRPRAVRTGSHGLFTNDLTPINLSKIASEVANHDGNIFTFIVSLKREDAENLHYDNVESWKKLARNQVENIATNLHVHMKNLRWYAAFHDESYHPHMHMVVYAVNEKPFLDKEGILNIKSNMAREIFGPEFEEMYKKENLHRDAIKKSSSSIIKNMLLNLTNQGYQNESIEEIFVRLTKSLEGYTGRKVYGYLPKSSKMLVNEIVNELEKIPEVKDLYNLWYEQREQIINIYQDEKKPRLSLKDNKEFLPIKNIIIKEAFNIINNDITFEDAPLIDIDFNKMSVDQQQYELAKTYLGSDTSEEQHQRGINLLLQSAEKHNGNAEYQIGKMLYFGTGIEQNQDQALPYLESSKESGNPTATLLLNNIQFTNKHPNLCFSAFRILCYLANLFNEQLQNDSRSLKTDRKQQRKTDQKKELHGLKLE